MSAADHALPFVSEGHLPVTNPPAVGVKRLSEAQIKSTEEWQLAQWRKWPREEDWPARMTVFEAAAYLRMHHQSLRRLLAKGRDGKAKLSHQMLGGIYRIRRCALDALGFIEARSEKKGNNIP